MLFRSRSAWMKLRQRGVSGWSLERVESVWRAAEESFFSGPRDEDAGGEGSDPADSAESRAAGFDAEVETARRWVQRRYRGLAAGAGPDHPARSGGAERASRDEHYREKQRALGALLRRGYSMAVARKAIEG